MHFTQTFTKSPVPQNMKSEKFAAHQYSPPNFHSSSHTHKKKLCKITKTLSDKNIRRLLNLIIFLEDFFSLIQHRISSKN